MATGNVAWVDYDSKIFALQSLTSALAAKTATGDGRARRRGPAAKVPVQSNSIAGCSSFEFVFGGRSQGAGGGGADEVICSIVAASRRGYRCLTSPSYRVRQFHFNTRQMSGVFAHDWQ